MDFGTIWIFLVSQRLTASVTLRWHSQIFHYLPEKGTYLFPRIPFDLHCNSRLAFTFSAVRASYRVIVCEIRYRRARSALVSLWRGTRGWALSCGNYERAKKKDVSAAQYLTSLRKAKGFIKEREREGEWAAVVIPEPWNKRNTYVRFREQLSSSWSAAVTPFSSKCFSLNPLFCLKGKVGRRHGNKQTDN